MSPALPAPSWHVTGAPRVVFGLAFVAITTMTTSAVGQNTDTIDITLQDDFGQDSDDESAVVNVFECREAVGKDLDFIVAFDELEFDDGSRSDYSIKIERASGACPSNYTETADDCELYEDQQEIPSDFTADVKVSWSRLTDITDNDGCRTASRTINLVVISERKGTTTEENNQDTTFVSDRFAITLEFDPPEAPGGLTATAGESSIRLSFDSPGDSTECEDYRAYITSDTELSEGTLTDDLADSGVRRVNGGSDTSITINDGVSVGETYSIAVVCRDANGNESPLSNVVSVTTTPTNDFFELYRQSGGKDGGGLCSTTGSPTPSAPSPWWLLVAVGGLVVALRRRLHPRQVLAVAVAASATLTLLYPGELLAQDEPMTGRFELRFGAYTPSVDDAIDVSPGPYEQVFDNDSMLLAEIEIDRVIFRDRYVGTAGVGGAFGFMQAVGKAIDDSGNQSVDTTVFNIIPLRLVGFYQLDILPHEVHVPLVPVVKAGLNYYLWWITESSGSIAREGGDSGSGGTFGWHFSLGLQLLLDWFDETAASNLRYEFGIDNSYFFAEYMLAGVDDFGDGDSINLSDETFMFGVAFDY